MIFWNYYDQDGLESNGQGREGGRAKKASPEVKEKKKGQESGGPRKLCHHLLFLRRLSMTVAFVIIYKNQFLDVGLCSVIVPVHINPSSRCGASPRTSVRPTWRSLKTLQAAVSHKKGVGGKKMHEIEGRGKGLGEEAVATACNIGAVCSCRMLFRVPLAWLSLLLHVV